jgi:hypothetical protein
MSANDRYFTNPVQYQRFLKDAQGKLAGAARGGIQGTVEPDKLKPGETIYRIGHSNRPDDVNISSPWWMRSQTFYEIASRAERHEIDFQDLFRHKAAVAVTFGVADLVLKATVQQQVRVLSGRGRPVIDVDEKTKEITGAWQGGLEITQLYIPGLREDPAREFSRPSAIYNTLIKVVMSVPVSDYMKENWAKRATGPF